MEQIKSRIAELSTDLVEQWLKVGGSAYYLRTASTLDILDSAYKNGLELRLIPVDPNLDISYNSDNQEGTAMTNIPLHVFQRIVTDLQIEPTASEQTFEIITDTVTYNESYTIVNGQRVNLGCQVLESFRYRTEETSNLSKWIYTNLGT